MSLQIAPSVLAADYTKLGAEVATVMSAGAKIIHFDVMDGHFVPPITIGALVVNSLSEQIHAAGGLVEVHLMVERPERHVADFARAGADVIVVHQEATPHLHYALSAVRAAGCQAGVAICPATPVELISEVVELVDSVLCMTVNPGWGGQAFIPTSVAKLQRLRALVGDAVAIEVDGGINLASIGPCARAGATRFVAGSALFNTPDPAVAYDELAAALLAAT